MLAQTGAQQHGVVLGQQGFGHDKPKGRAQHAIQNARDWRASLVRIATCYKMAE